MSNELWIGLMMLLLFFALFIILITSDNKSTPHSDKTARQQTIARLIEKQNTIKNLIIFNTILLLILLAIIVFVIIKVYPYLDTLKEYYQLLDNMKQWIN